MAVTTENIQINITASTQAAVTSVTRLNNVLNEIKQRIYDIKNVTIGTDVPKDAASRIMALSSALQELKKDNNFTIQINLKPTNIEKRIESISAGLAHLREQMADMESLAIPNIKETLSELTSAANYMSKMRDATDTASDSVEELSGSFGGLKTTMTGVFKSFTSSFGRGLFTDKMVDSLKSL